jgi:hypothetical protein
MKINRSKSLRFFFIHLIFVFLERLEIVLWLKINLLISLTFFLEVLIQKQVKNILLEP